MKIILPQILWGERLFKRSVASVLWWLIALACTIQTDIKTLRRHFLRRETARSDVECIFIIVAQFSVKH